MSSKLILGLITGFFVVAGAGCVLPGASTSPSASSPTLSKPTTTAPTSSGFNIEFEPNVYKVKLLRDRAEPATIRVYIGEIVQFNSADGQSHSLVQEVKGDTEQTPTSTAEFLKSGVFKADEGYRVQFKKPGLFFFRDELHPAITASVTALSWDAKK